MRYFRRTPPRSTRQKAKVEVTKKAVYNPADKNHKRAAAGETVKYDIFAANIGNVDLTETGIADTLFDRSEGIPQLVLAVSEPSSRLAPFSFHEKIAGKQEEAGNIFSPVILFAILLFFCSPGKSSPKQNNYGRQ